ncbi:type II toxin-antitoxin system RelE/ParE family toxin [Candidatus Binatus sp.]|uniref:type II toxin-antitoxin system RelE/ParE family toxin n=1 Tax=Candidatus Binatus sp. TaxID=2811406 RepID=UPI003BAF47B6
MDIFERVSADDSSIAARWFNGLEAAIDTLEQFPHRCPVAPDSKRANRVLRHLLYGSKRDVYRVINDIDEPRKLVRVRAVRHSAMDEFIP